MTNPLISVTATRTGDRVEAVTGSTKTKDLQSRAGEVIGYTRREITETHAVREAVVRLDNGDEVITHRVRRTH